MINVNRSDFSDRLNGLWRNSYTGKWTLRNLDQVNSLWKSFLAKLDFSIQWNLIVESLLTLVLIFMPVLSAKTSGVSWVLLIPLVLLQWMVNPSRNEADTRQPFRAGYVFLWLVLAVSACFNTGFNRGITDLFRFGYWFFLSWLVGRAFTVETSRRVLKYLVFSSVLWLIVGFWQLVSGMVTPKGWLAIEQAEIIPVRIYSVFGNPNIFALYLLSILVFCFYFWAGASRKTERILLGAIFIALLAALYFTYARMAWFVAVVFMAFQLQKYWHYGLFYAGIGLVMLLLIPGFQVRIGSLVNLSDSSAGYRIQIWRGVWQAIRDYWLWGSGPGSFPWVYSRYQLGGIASQHAHQFYLQFWLEHGLLSLLTFLAVIKRLLISGPFGLNPPLIIPLAIVPVIFLVYGFSETWYVHSFCGGYFWLLTGLLTAVKRVKQCF